MEDPIYDELAYYRSLFQHAPIGFFLYRIADGQLVTCNEVAAQLFGYANCTEFLSTGQLARHYAEPGAEVRLVDDLRSGVAVSGVELTFRRKDGTVFYGRCSAVLYSEDMLGIVLLDISATVRTKNALRHSEQRFHELVELLPQNVFELDLSGNVLYGNSNCYETFGYTPEEFTVGAINAFDSVIPEDRERMRANMCRVVIGETMTCNEYNILRTDGTTFPALIYSNQIMQDGRPVGIRGLIVDITERKQAEKRLNELAYFDQLTGLPNRTHFRERLDQSLREIHASQQYIAVMLLDLDRFKEVNDTLGHGMGDQLLQCVAKRLSACMREHDTVCRLGGDEFVIILPDIHGLSHAESMAQRIIMAFREPFIVDGYELHITVSIGICFAPLDGSDTSTLLKNADLAMYSAKSREQGGYAFFSVEMDRQFSERAELTQDLRKAIERNEFTVYFQPIVSLKRQRTVGVEALVRWQHPQRGLLLPGEFLPLAEDLGLVETINEWVLYTACQQCMRWRDLGLSPLRLSVNVSPGHLYKPGFMGYVEQVLRETGFPATDLLVEITENAAMQNPLRTDFVLNALHRTGINIALDDFGTGYSSFSHLQKFSAQTLKIDRTLIREIPANHDHVTIVSAIIALAKALQISVVAEGVENTEQVASLRALDCDLVQGFLFARPMPADDLVTYLAQPCEMLSAVPS